jgi:prepilin-type N-terminal cleavage/methylation domain-containing protein
MQTQIHMIQKKHGGFTLIELLVAMLVLMIGLVAVAQLVPMSVRLNSGNRDDSTAMAFAQRELDAMIEQPISITAPLGFTDPNGILCPPLTTCLLGDAMQPKVLVGSPVLMINNRPQIDYSAAQVPGYSFNYTDPNDPYAITYDVRWAVITYANGGNPTAKRFILGALRRTNNATFLPLTLDTMVEK